MSARPDGGDTVVCYRNLICVALPAGDPSGPIRDCLSTQWNVTVARDIENADAWIRRHPFHVGIVVVTDASRVDLAQLQLLLHAHPDLQWIGVFPPGLSDVATWRELIVESLV